MREWLKSIRSDKCKTQEDIALLVGISRPGYTRIENGHRNPSPELAIKIAKVLDFDWKLFFEDNS